MASVRISESAIKFIQRFGTICTAGQIKDPKDKHFGMWLGAIIHAETHKLIINTPPVFKKKLDAIAFMEDLRTKAKRELFKMNQVVEIN